jgi:hypothetical protein
MCHETEDPIGWLLLLAPALLLFHPPDPCKQLQMMLLAAAASTKALPLCHTTLASSAQLSKQQLTPTNTPGTHLECPMFIATPPSVCAVITWHRTLQLSLARSLKDAAVLLFAQQH